MVADRPPERRSMPMGLMVVGSEMAGFTVVGILLDYALHTMPGFTVGLTLLGVVVVFVHLARFARSMSNPTPPPGENGGRR